MTSATTAKLIARLSGVNYRVTHAQPGRLRLSTDLNLTAYAAGGAPSAAQLVLGLNRVTTVASAVASVKLPIAQEAGDKVTVINSGANAMQVFSPGGTINGVAAASGVSQPAGTTAEYIALGAVAGSSWNRLLSA